MINTIHEDWVSCEMVMYVIVAASVDANRILVDEERLILAARCFFFFRWVNGFVALFVLFSLIDPLYGGIGGFRWFGGEGV